MKKVFFVMAAFAVALLLAFRSGDKRKIIFSENNDTASREKAIIRCSPDWNELKDWLEEADIPPMPGAGSHKWKISTTSDSAQFYFNQGINIYYGFHIIEAMASFKKAAKFDSGCAMLYWAQALGYGLNINDFGYRASPEALAALNKAKEPVSGISAMEKELIDAMSLRYTVDSADATRAQLNRDYTAGRGEWNCFFNAFNRFYR